jgi:intein-encoded DNA endonuclease-like protein
VTIRKVSHKCILEYVRKFKDFETVMSIYLKTAMQQTENSHLKLKATNSFHSLLMAETKYFSHDFDCSRPFLEELIHSSYQKDYVEIRRAALITLIFILRVAGV